MIGSLSLPLKLLAKTAGVSGSKKRGLKELERVATEGHWARDVARVLLMDLYKREKRWDDAIATARSLSDKYPRNYLFKLQLADAIALKIAAARKAKNPKPAIDPAEEREVLVKPVAKFALGALTIALVNKIATSIPISIRI